MNRKVTRKFLIVGPGLLGALILSSACAPAVENDRPSAAAPAVEMGKVAVQDPNKSDVASISWGAEDQGLQ